MFGVIAAALYTQSPVLTCLIMAWSIGMFLREHAILEKTFIQAQRGAVLTSDGERAEVLMASEIDQIFVKQHLIGRLFNFGTIVFVDAKGKRRPIGPVRNPHAFRKALLSNL